MANEIRLKQFTVGVDRHGRILVPITFCEVTSKGKETVPEAITLPLGELPDEVAAALAAVEAALPEIQRRHELLPVKKAATEGLIRERDAKMAEGFESIDEVRMIMANIDHPQHDEVGKRVSVLKAEARAKIEAIQSCTTAEEVEACLAK
jgi:hypothetical protein